MRLILCRLSNLLLLTASHGPHQFTWYHLVQEKSNSIRMDIGTNLIGMQDLEEFSEIQMDNGYWDIMERLRVSLASLEAEIWGIYTGLTIILEKSMSYITIESDSHCCESDQ